MSAEQPADEALFFRGAHPAHFTSPHAAASFGIEVVEAREMIKSVRDIQREFVVGRPCESAVSARAFQHCSVGVHYKFSGVASAESGNRRITERDDVGGAFDVENVAVGRIALLVIDENDRDFAPRFGAGGQTFAGFGDQILEKLNALRF